MVWSSFGNYTVKSLFTLTQLWINEDFSLVVLPNETEGLCFCVLDQGCTNVFSNDPEVLIHDCHNPTHCSVHT